MPRSFYPRLMSGVLVMLGIAVTPIWAAETDPLVGVWQKVSTYLTKEALLQLKDLPQPGDPNAQREYDFCAAVVQLDQQPLSESRLDDVEMRLKTLLNTDTKDEIDGASRYLLGRIVQLYRAEPNVVMAAKYYRELIERAGPGHWADIARVKLAVLILYALPATDAKERIDRAGALLVGTDDALAMRDLHRVLGRGVLFYNLPPPAAFDHLLAADKIGGLVGTLGADQLVQIGELAWDVGDENLAIKYYEKLRTEYPRDPRIFLMDQRLAGNPVPQRSEKIHGR